MKRGFWLVLIPSLALACVAGWMWLPPQLGARPAPPDDKKAAEPNQQLLETVGTLAAGQLYQAYLNIGLIADGKAEGVYEEKDVLQILGSVLGVINALDKSLEKTGKLDLSKEDRESLAQMRKLAGLLRQQGDELQAFWKTGDKERGAKYEKSRKEAWEGISKLLNL